MLSRNIQAYSVYARCHWAQMAGYSKLCYRYLLHDCTYKWLWKSHCAKQAVKATSRSDGLLTTSEVLLCLWYHLSLSTSTYHYINNVHHKTCVKACKGMSPLSTLLKARPDYTIKYVIHNTIGMDGAHITPHRKLAYAKTNSVVPFATCCTARHWVWESSALGCRLWRSTACSGGKSAIIVPEVLLWCLARQPRGVMPGRAVKTGAQLVWKEWDVKHACANTNAGSVF